jgi:hypothetical protein
MPHEKFNHGPPGERERIYQATSLIALVSDGISSRTRFRVFQQNRPKADIRRSFKRSPKLPVGRRLGGLVSEAEHTFPLVL